ncbi:MAG: discoidin domain-containing protein [Longicatena sp.]
MKKILNIALVAAMVISGVRMTTPVYAFDAPEMNFKEKRNYALTGAASAYKSPISYWGANKLNDGIVNRDAAKRDQSRWSSEEGAPGWIKIDLKEEKKIKEFFCAFENNLTREFHIDTSTNDVDYTKVYASADTTAGIPMDTRVTLHEAVNARYVRLTIDALIDGAYPSLSMYEFEVIGEEDYTDLALNSNAVSDHSEGNGLDAAKTVDGKFEKNSRWSSNFEGSNTLTYTFENEITLASLILEWERCNALTYHIQVLKDENWVNVKDLTTPRNFSDKINLDAPVVTKGVRIIIDDFFNAAPNRDGEEIDYGTVSLYEVGMYDKAITIAPEKEVTAKEVADNLVIKPITSNSLKMPIVPKGFEISFIGADYEEIISRDMKVIKPLTAQNVTVNFEVKKTTLNDKGEEVVDKSTSPAFVVAVPGIYDENTSNNAKPTVMPELQQWFGHEGDFEINDSSRIVVDPSAAEFMESAQAFAADYKDILKKEISVVTESNPQKGDFYFKKSAEILDDETYKMDINEFVTIEATHNTGAYWSTRTILQILKQTKTTIAKGLVKDYPKYEVRGFMLDVARRPIKIEFLQDLVKTMSWYKLSNFHIHLNDNCFGKLPDGKTPDYSGFRLESDIPNLTNTDYFYTKNDFRDFIKSSKKVGVNIIPEFDTPGHSGAFIRARPDLARADSNEYLDVENPESIKFVESVFEEYTSGDDPVFPKGTVVHIGTDEYKNGNKEAFRKFQDDLLKFMRDKQGYTPRVWGSQTENAGITPITVEGVEMNLWYSGYANPKEMYEKGYDLVNTNDGDLYIVPGANYYFDYLDQNHIANVWQPNKIGNFTIPVGDDQMLGSTFAVWNDKTGPSIDNGTSDVEIFDRIYHILPTFAAKLWGDIRDYSINDINKLTEKVNYAPNSNPTYQVDSVDSTVLNYNFNSDKGLDKSGNDYNLKKQENVSYDQGKNYKSLTLNGGSSYVQTPVDNLGINSEMEFWIKRESDSTNEEQIIFESDNGAIKAVQKETGKFGFSREFHDYSFNYELPKGEWVKLKLDTSLTVTKLYVNDQLIDTLSIKDTGKKWASLVIPLERIGSETKAFKGQIDDVVIGKKAQTMTATASSEEPQNKAKNAVDGNLETIWHTKWDGSDVLPQSITLNLSKAMEIDAFNYLPRQTGSNGIITKYILEVSEDGTSFTKVSEGSWAQDATQKTVEFNATKAQYVRLTAVEGVGGFASAAEINVRRTGPDTDKLDRLIVQAKALSEQDYTPVSWETFKNALKDAEAVVANKDATQEEVDAIRTVLDSAIDALEERDGISIDDLAAAYEKCIKLEETEYTTSSWTAMDKAIKQANAVLEAQNPKKDDINNAFKALNDAFGNLVKRAQTSSIHTLKNSVDELEALRAQYTAAEFIEASKAIENAALVLAKDDTDTSEQEVNAGMILVATAKGNLKHNVLLDALRVLCENADKILASDEINNALPEKVQALKDTRKAAQQLLDDNSIDEAVISATTNNLYKAMQELYKIVNTDNLTKLLEEAGKLIEGNYTEVSWKNVLAACDIVKAVISNKDATEEEVQNAYDGLFKAMGELEVRIDKSTLRKQLDIAKVVLDNYDKYILSTVKGLQKVVDEANAVYENINATKEEIKVATDKLIVEMAKARLKADKSVLEDAMKAVDALDLNKYTSVGANRVKAAYEKAQKIMNKEDATQQEIDLAVLELNKAIEMLEKIPPKKQEGVDTSDSTKIAGIVTLVVLSGIVLVVLKKRKRSN